MNYFRIGASYLPDDEVDLLARQRHSTDIDVMPLCRRSILLAKLGVWPNRCGAAMAFSSELVSLAAFRICAMCDLAFGVRSSAAMIARV